MNKEVTIGDIKTIVELMRYETPTKKDVQDVLDFIESQQRTKIELLEHCRDLSVNHDCDSDAHKYGTSCYVCESKRLYDKHKE